MIDQIKNFNKQFEYKPVIENGEIQSFKGVVIAGMGGSHLAADLIKCRKPELDLTIHKDYGLPQGDLGGKLLIANSYSGNTEEIVDFLEHSINKNLNIAVVATGGRLIEIAKDKNIPYIQIPDTGIQPRSALGFTSRALLKIMGEEDLLEETNDLVNINPSDYEEQGKDLADRIGKRMPVIYSSTMNEALASIWKVKFNETAKLPAFYNVFPELNHNEMIGFSEDSNVYFIFLVDSMDHLKVLRRMEVTEKLFKDMNLSVETLNLRGEGFKKIFESLLLADWTAYYHAVGNDEDPEEVPLVEKFKELI